MYKIILADDEPLIIKGLKKMVQWERLDARIIGEAQDGVQLWQLIEEEQPDIVITDIAMPNATGLDVIKKIKEKGWDIKVIFLSGYQEFSYAKIAIQYGAVDYLLKPVTAEELEEAVGKAQQILQKNRPETLWEEKNDMQEIFRNMNSSYESANFYERFQEIGIDTKEKLFQGVCFALSGKALQTIQDHNMFELLRFNVFKKIQEYMKNEKLGFALRRDDNSTNLVLVLPKENAAWTADEAVQKAIELIKREYHVELVVGMGTTVEEISELKFAYKTAKFASELYYFQQQNIIRYQDINREFNRSFEDYNKAYKVFVQSVLNRDERWQERLSECLDMIENLHYGNRYAAENRCIVLAADFYRSLKEYNQVDEQGQQEFEAWMDTLRSQVTWTELRKEILGYFGEFIPKVYSSQGQGDCSAVYQIKAYIKSHYSQDISLGQMAKMFYMNPYYFSTFFKKETGQNFKNYVTQVRMEEALKILIEKDLKTYELAEAVGYRDVKSFTEKFRETYGESPAAYKKKLH